MAAMGCEKPATIKEHSFARVVPLQKCENFQLVLISDPFCNACGMFQVVVHTMFFILFCTNVHRMPVYDGGRGY